MHLHSMTCIWQFSVYFLIVELDAGTRPNMCNQNEIQLVSIREQFYKKIIFFLQKIRFRFVKLMFLRILVGKLNI